MDSVRPPRSKRNSSLKSAFEKPYVGDVHKCFIEALDYYSELPVNEKPYMKTISVVQSSGMGKSRMVDEAASLLFTIPANLRETLPTGVKTYPPPDVVLRSFFETHENKSDELLQAEYAILLKCIFDTAASKVPAVVESRKGEALAVAWSCYLKGGQTVEGVGQPRATFYAEAVAAAKSRSKKFCEWDGDGLALKTSVPLSTLFEEMAISANTMLQVLNHDGSVYKNACLFYFDEAHSLTISPKTGNSSRTRSRYHNLGSVLARLVRLPIFFIFLSTNTHLQKFAPSTRDHPSLRVLEGAYFIPPFTELPFDIFTNEALEKLTEGGKPRSIRNACNMEVMSSMGRPLWFAHNKLVEEQRILPPGASVDKVVDMAVAKLTSAGSPLRASQAELAALSVRVGIAFESMSPAAREVESQQVESHMRIVYAIPEHREYMRTGSSSEPVLAEAAGVHLNYISKHRGIYIEAPRILSENCQKGFLARGKRGELCGRLLLTVAHDIAVIEASHTTSALLKDIEPAFHRPVPVLDFLRALFAEDHHETILKATPVSDKPEAKTLETTFQEAFVFFSHFALAEDSDMLASKSLRTALFRGMALQAKDNQPSIDAVIPIHMKGIDEAITTRTTSAINLQFKNRQRSLDCPVDRTITVPDLENPAISIVFEFGETNAKLLRLQAHHQSHCATRSGKIHPDDNHYSFVARGFGPETYKSIPAAAVGYYRSILATGGLKDDFPRAERA
ncbi:unnamed protein product, partial [Rhizoctonia solani]